MTQEVPETPQLGPWNAGTVCLGFVSELFSRLANAFQTSLHRIVRSAIRQKYCSVHSRRVILNPADVFQNVLKTLNRVLEAHRPLGRHQTGAEHLPKRRPSEPLCACSSEGTQRLGLYAPLDPRLEASFFTQVDSRAQQIRQPKLQSNNVKHR